jgi:hypothetical protein
MKAIGIGLGLVLWICTATAGEPPAPGTNVTAILDTATGLWRTHLTYRTPDLVGEDGRLSPLPVSNKDTNPAPVTCTGYPDKDWAAPEFDDAAWARARGAIGPAQGLGYSLWDNGRAGWTKTICVRGKFAVTDPAAAKNLKVAVEYNGGAVVYVNGKEVRRANLPGGELGFEALAERYPQEAYVRPDGKQLSPGNDKEFGFDSKEFADRFALRSRSLEVDIPPTLLRKGMNVLAVAVYRAPFNEAPVKAPFSKSNWRGAWGPWPHARLLGARLTAGPGETAVVPNVGRPQGVQLWTAHASTPISPDQYADPFDKPQPLRLVGFRRGEFSAQVVVSSTEPIEGLKVLAGDLADPKSGAKLPASVLALRYPMWEGARVDGFSEKPPEDGKVKMQPAWVTVRTPADAKAGLYEGKVTVEAKGLAASEVPLSIKVSDWCLPDSKDFLTHNHLWQSTESVALRYKVPLWSDKHFELIGRSLELSKPLANKFCEIHLMAYAEDIGNSEGMVYWIEKKSSGVSVQVSGGGKKEEGSAPDTRHAAPAADSAPSDTRHLTPDTYTYDFTVFDRYLDLYAAKVGKPGLLLIDVWKWAADRDKAGPGGYKVSGTNIVRVSKLDPGTKKVEQLIPPLYGSPEGLAFWKPVLTQVRQRLEKRGWMDVACLGTGSDDAPRPPTVAMFKEIWPDVPWLSSGHVCPSQYKSGTNATVAVRAAEWVWGAGGLWNPSKGNEYPRPWKSAPSRHSLAFPREGAGAAMVKQGYSAWDYRWNPEKVLQCNLAGIGRVCLDCWPIPGRRDLVCGGPGQYNFPASITAFLHPGPDGAQPTVRSEMYREGVQVREAMTFLQKAVDANKVEGELAQRCSDLLVERARNVLHPMGPQNWLEQEGRLYELCAEVSAKPARK